MSTQHKAALVGATGLIGSNILTTLLAHSAFSSITTFSRSPLTSADPQSKLNSVVSKDSATWATSFPSNPAPEVFFSALGTTRGKAGGVENQRKIDYDLNLELAKAAKQAGVRVYVLISSGGADASSSFAYMKMKGELENAVKDLDFEKTVILQPGLIVGNRQNDFRAPELILRKLANAMGAISGNKLKDFWAQDADVIARSAVSAGLKALSGEAPEGKSWLVTQADVIKLGRTEWKE